MIFFSPSLLIIFSLLRNQQIICLCACFFLCYVFIPFCFLFVLVSFLGIFLCLFCSFVCLFFVFLFSLFSVVLSFFLFVMLGTYTSYAITSLCHRPRNFNMFNLSQLVCSLQEFSTRNFELVCNVWTGYVIIHVCKHSWHTMQVIWSSSRCDVRMMTKWCFIWFLIPSFVCGSLLLCWGSFVIKFCSFVLS